VSAAWVVILAVGALTVGFKAAGPVLLGGRALPDRVLAVVELAAPVLLVALVVTATVAGDEEIVVDERLAGVTAAGVALWRGAPLLAAMSIAAAVTAALRGLM
jgi:branched-subunit amino acid transport protein